MSEKILQITTDVALSHGIFTRQTMAQLSEQLEEPDWLQERRHIAWSLFEDMPMPTLQDEHWRRTDLRAIKWGALELPDIASVERASSLELIPERLRSALDTRQQTAGRLVLLNGYVVWQEADPEVTSQGVLVTDLLTAARQYPELVQEHLMRGVTPGEGKFVALNSALWNGGAFIYVPRGVKIAQPFEIILGLAGQNIAVFPRTLLIAEADASVTVIEDMVSLDHAGQAFSAAVSEIIAGERASVTYAELQRWGEHVFSCNTRRAVHSAQSHVTWDLGYLGGRLHKTFLDSILAADGASCMINGVYLARNHQHIDLDLTVHHSARHTQADLLIKGAARDRGRAVLRGLIRIDQSGQQADSYLKNDNLILSDRARIDSIPSLVIDAHDVHASHGATVARIDEEHIFYLQSRGISRELATRLLIEGFFASVLGRVEQEDIRRRFAEAVASRLDT